MAVGIRRAVLGEAWAWSLELVMLRGNSTRLQTRVGRFSGMFYKKVQYANAKRRQTRCRCRCI
jgi:hypothetical protein